jgi:hypothetical protein
LYHIQEGHFYETILMGLFYSYIKKGTIKRKNIKSNGSVFDIFTDFRNVKCKIVTIIKGDISTTELKEITTELNQGTTLKEQKNNIIENEKIVDNMDDIDNEYLNEKKYYIVSINDKDIRKYIYGTLDEPSDDDILSIIDNMDLKLEYPEYEILYEISCNTKIEVLEKIDEYIKENDTNNNGYNLFYNVKKEHVFIMKQQEIMNDIYDNDEISSKICYIEHNNRKYIFKSDNGNTIKDTLNYIYYMRKETCNNEYQSILQILEKTKFIDLKIGIIEKNIKPTELNNMYEYYRNNIEEIEPISNSSSIKTSLTPKQKYAIYQYTKNKN